jgi:2-haloacid dehalogenase
MATIDFGRVEVLTFDCYGTLIDWERGILAGLRPLLGTSGAAISDDELLERYAVAEATIEAGPYRRYREVLARAAEQVARELGAAPEDAALAAFGGSVGDWPAFPDSADALARLKTRFRLGVITNCDDDLFAASNERLGVAFDEVVTAEQAGAYKPSPQGFDLAFERLGVPRDRIVHVAQSLFHDHVTARRLGLATAWIDRRRGREGSGATPPATVTPDITAPSMAAFADLALA